jgi:hypothetical protein
MSNDITELRSALFDTLRGIKDGSIDIEKAKAINDTCQTLVNTAKVEINYLLVTNTQPDSVFFTPEAKQLPNGTTVVDKSPGVTVTRHRLHG